DSRTDRVGHQPDRPPVPFARRLAAGDPRDRDRRYPGRRCLDARHLRVPRPRRRWPGPHRRPAPTNRAASAHPRSPESVRRARAARMVPADGARRGRRVVEMDQAILVSALVFLLIVQAVMLASTGRIGERERIGHRLVKYTVPTWEGGLPARISVLRRRRYSRLPVLDELLARLDLADGISRQLQQAGLPVRAGEFLFLQLAVATIGGLVGALAGWETFGGPYAALGAAFLGFLGPMIWLRIRIGQRRAAFEMGLPEALDRVTGALRAGYGLEYGFDIIARDGQPPCSEEFGQVLQELNLGGDLEEALARLIQRMPSEDARLLATAVAVQRRTGGNLIEVLGQMASMLRERDRLRRDVRVITTAPRVSGYVVALLPMITLVAMYVTSRYYIDTLLAEPIGRVAAAVGGVLVLVGLFLNHRIAQVDM